MASITQEEVEALHERVCAFVLANLRTSGNPAIHARPLVHCKTGVSHMIVPLSGVNDMTWTAPLAEAMEKAFPPDGHLRTRALPDASQVIYELIVPLSAGYTGRHRSKHRGYDDGAVVRSSDAQSGLLQNPLVLLLGLLLAAGVGYVLLVSPMLSK